MFAWLFNYFSIIIFLYQYLFVSLQYKLKIMSTVQYLFFLMILTYNITTISKILSKQEKKFVDHFFIGFYASLVILTVILCIELILKS